MKNSVRIMIITTLMLVIAANASAQTSDYQIKQNFEQRFSELKASVEVANTVSEMDSLKEEITFFAENYENHTELLDNALYPESYESSINELKQQARNSEHKLLIIENQNEKLQNLSKQLASYRSEIDNLNSRSDSLRKAIDRSQNSERDLSKIVERYRNSLQERDKFVLNMIDSLFINYKDLLPEEVAELSEETDFRKLEGTDANPLEFIQNVIEHNTQIVKSSGSSLQTEDYLRMYVIQSRFSEVWSQIGNDLTTIYGGNDSRQWKLTIDKKLQDWKATTSRNMWASIDKHLDEKNIELGAFDNNESFYAAIESFVKKATDSSRDKVITSDNYEDFQAFYDFWNGKIKNDWGDFVKEGEVLTMSQISSIDTEIMNWRDESKPKSFLIPILLGLSLLTIVGLIIVLARR
ncbi:MAG: hypothetical protein WD361_05270 [Gracilimonas sp.]